MNYKSLIKDLETIFENLEKDDWSLSDLSYYDDAIQNIFDELEVCKKELIDDRLSNSFDEAEKEFEYAN